MSEIRHELLASAVQRAVANIHDYTRALEGDTLHIEDEETVDLVSRLLHRELIGILHERFGKAPIQAAPQAEGGAEAAGAA